MALIGRLLNPSFGCPIVAALQWAGIQFSQGGTAYKCTSVRVYTVSTVVAVFGPSAIVLKHRPSLNFLIKSSSVSSVSSPLMTHGQQFFFKETSNIHYYYISPSYVWSRRVQGSEGWDRGDSVGKPGFPNAHPCNWVSFKL